MSGIQLHSQAFNDHKSIPHRHARAGKNLSPALRWSGVPAGTTELVLLCEDPDAPGGTFLHWLVTGIDPSSTGVDEGQTPQGGQEWPNDYGSQGWGGPNPPVGDTHRYVFHLYALPRSVQLPARPTVDGVHHIVDRTGLASGTLVGLYQR